MKKSNKENEAEKRKKKTELVEKRRMKRAEN